MNKIMALTVAIVGLLLFIFAVLADVIGFGDTRVFGWMQIAGTVVGLIAAVGGYWYYRRLA